MTENTAAFLAVILAATATYALRLGGLLLAGKLPDTGRARRFMDALPGTILLSIVVPASVSLGPWGWFASACTIACMRLTGNVLAAMLSGVVIMALSRAL